jgi:arginine decarboxylase
VINLYCQLKKICPELDSINIGGGFPIKHSLGFEYDYQFMINEIVRNIKVACVRNKVQMPNIFTEFGSYTVGESMAHIYSVIGEKRQNDREILEASPVIAMIITIVRNISTKYSYQKQETENLCM